jgi:hypothetical protein
MTTVNKKRKFQDVKSPVPIWNRKAEPVSKKQKLYREYLKMSLETEKKLLEYENLILSDRQDLVASELSRSKKSSILSKIIESELKKARDAEREESEKIKGIKKSIKKKTDKYKMALVKRI